MKIHERPTKCPRCHQAWVGFYGAVETTGTYRCKPCHVNFSFAPVWWEFEISGILHSRNLSDVLVISSDGFSYYYDADRKETILPPLPFDISAERLKILLMMS